MTIDLRESGAYRKPIFLLSKALYRDREALLQLLLSLCRKNTLRRISSCPTFPVANITADLEERLDLFHNAATPNPYEISYALAVLFESAVERKHRRNMGQYFTPTQVARKAIAFLNLKHGETVLDPGSGTGIFPLTILRKFSEDSANFESLRYIGVENDPILALSTAISLDWVEAPANWRVLYANFLNVHIDDLKKAFWRDLSIDAIIANPPFVRSNKLNGIEGLTEELNMRASSGLHSLFLARSAKLLGKGRMIFLVPLEMTETRYGSDLLEQLRRSFTITNKIMYYDNKNNTWNIKELKKLTVERHSQIRKVWTFMLLRNPSNGAANRSIARQSRMGSKTTVPLGSIALTHRGISTGANKFFVLTDEMAKEMEVYNTRYLKKVIPTRIRQTELPTIFEKEDWNNLRKKGKRCWLLSLPSQRERPREELPPIVRQYLRKGESQGIHLIPTCRNRETWYHIKTAIVPQLIFTYMSRGYPRFIYNKARAHYLTNLLGVYLKTHIKHQSEKLPDLAELLTSELRKWIDQESAGRKYAGGLIKFEPGDLKNMPISEHLLINEIGFTSLSLHFDW